MAYKVCYQQAKTEKKYQLQLSVLADKRAQSLEGLTGTALEKQTELTAKCRAEEEQSEVLKSEVDFWKRTGRLIENKISLGQSVLANITSQVKAGMYFNNVK